VGPIQVQVVLVEAARRVAGQAKLGEGGDDPIMLGPGEGHRIDRAAPDDRLLEGGVAAAQARVGAQGVPEAAQGGDLRAAGRDTCTWTR
jgi:hypothetical protein